MTTMHTSPQPRWRADWTERKRGGFNQQNNWESRNEQH